MQSPEGSSGGCIILQLSFIGVNAGCLMLYQTPAVFPDIKGVIMANGFKVGDHVEWNSEAGRVRGHIIQVITAPIQFKGYTRHASETDPQYRIKSDKTDHIAIHKGSALTRIE